MMNKTVSEVNKVTATNVTERDLGHELFETRTGIEYALIKLEKADTLLNHWVQEYGFCRKTGSKSSHSMERKSAGRKRQSRSKRL